MQPFRPDEGDGMVFVRLSDVPLRVRVRTAERMIRDGTVSGFADQVMLRAYAEEPFQNPGLLVTIERARRVLG